MAILEVDRVCKRFGGLTAVDEATFSVEHGSITSLVGPNGAGKTTLFNMISGFLSLTAGEVRLRGNRISGQRAFRIARMGVGRTFQEPRIFVGMNVRDHVVAGFRLRGENPARALFTDRKTRAQTREARLRADGLLETIGLAHRADDMAQDLSFGEQRFLSILRMLAGDPSIVLLDEPTVGLDAAAIRQLSAIITSMAREEKRTILIVEHNLDVVFSISDRIHLLVAGKVVLSGDPAEIRSHPRMIEAYLGAAHA